MDLELGMHGSESQACHLLTPLPYANRWKAFTLHHVNIVTDVIRTIIIIKNETLKWYHHDYVAFSIISNQFSSIWNVNEIITNINQQKVQEYKNHQTN